MKRHHGSTEPVRGVSKITMFGGFAPVDEGQPGVFKADNFMFLFDVAKNKWDILPYKLHIGCVRETIAYCAATQMNDGSVIVLGTHPTRPDAIAFQVTLTGVTNKHVFYNTVGAVRAAARADASLVTLHDGRIMRVGGIVNPGANDPTVAITIKNNPLKWSICTPDVEIGAGCFCVVLDNGNVLITGGHIMVLGVILARTVCVLFETKKDTFKYTGHMGKQRTYHSGCLLKNGNVFVSGGMDSGETAELYDVTTEKWTPLPNMLFQRMSHQCQLLQGGQQIFIYGGASEIGANIKRFGNKCEFYNTDVNTFTPAPDMPVPRAKFFSLVE